MSSSLLDYISLKPNCTNRLFKAGNFPPSKDAFLLEEFTSDHFLTKLTQNSYPPSPLTSDSAIFTNLIQTLEAHFEKLQEQLLQTKKHLISQAYSLFSEEATFLRTESLKEELKRLHQKALSSNLDPSILEDFASVYHSYRLEMETKPKDISLNQLVSFKKVTDQITSEIKQVLETSLIKSKEKLIPVPELVVKPLPSDVKQYTPKEVIQEGDREIKGCWLEYDGKYSLLCIGYDQKVYNELLKVRLYAVKEGKLCQSLYNSDRLPHAYCSKLKCLAFCYTKGNAGAKKLAVELHRIGAKGARKVSELSIELDNNYPITFGKSPLLNYSTPTEKTDIKLVFIDSKGILLVKQSHQITLVNILTRKVLYNKAYMEGVLDVNYAKDFDSVVVLTSTNIHLYSIDERTHSFLEFYSHPIFMEGEALEFLSGRIFIEHNIIFASVKQTHKTEPHRPCLALEIVGSEIKCFDFLVHSAIRFVPVINVEKRKICLFGILPWLKYNRRRDIIFDFQTGKLDDGDSYDDHSGLKNIIYADSRKTIMQKRLESGAQKIVFYDNELLMRTD